MQWGGEQRLLPPAHISVAAPEPHWSRVVPLIGDKRHYGEPAGGSGAGLKQPGARSLAVWSAKLGSDGPPRLGRRVKGQGRRAAGRVILQPIPVLLPSERARSPHVFISARGAVGLPELTGRPAWASQAVPPGIAKGPQETCIISLH